MIWNWKLRFVHKSQLQQKYFWHHYTRELESTLLLHVFKDCFDLGFGDFYGTHNSKGHIALKIQLKVELWRIIRVVWNACLMKCWSLLFVFYRYYIGAALALSPLATETTSKDCCGPFLNPKVTRGRVFKCLFLLFVPVSYLLYSFTSVLCKHSFHVEITQNVVRTFEIYFYAMLSIRRTKVVI